MFIKRDNKWGQVFLGFVFAFIALILLTVGLIRVWAWFSANLSGRSYYYQRTRINSSRGVQYSELDKATHRPFTLDDDWIFKGKTPHMPVLHLENLDPEGGIDAAMCCENCCTGKAHAAGCACKKGTVFFNNLQQLQNMGIAHTEFKYFCDLNHIIGVLGASIPMNNWVPDFVSVLKYPPPNPPDPSTFFGNKGVVSPDTIDLTSPTKMVSGATGGWWGHVLGGVTSEVGCTDSKGNAQPCLCQQRCRCRVAVMAQINALRAQAAMQRESAGQYDDSPNPPGRCGLLGNAHKMYDKANDCGDPWDICWYFSGFGKASREMRHAGDLTKRQGENLVLATDPIDGGAGNSLGYIGELQNCCEQSCATPEIYDISTKEGIKGLDDCNKRAIDSCLAEARSHIGDDCERYANITSERISDDANTVNKEMVTEMEQQAWAQTAASSCVKTARNYCAWKLITPQQKATIDSALHVQLPPFVEHNTCYDGSTPPQQVSCNVSPDYASGGVHVYSSADGTSSGCFRKDSKGNRIGMDPIPCPATPATELDVTMKKRYSGRNNPLIEGNRANVTGLDIFHPNAQEGYWADDKFDNMNPTNNTDSYMASAVLMFQQNPLQKLAFDNCMGDLSPRCCKAYSSVEGQFYITAVGGSLSASSGDKDNNPVTPLGRDCFAPTTIQKQNTTPLDTNLDTTSPGYGKVIMPPQVNGNPVQGGTINYATNSDGTTSPVSVTQTDVTFQTGGLVYAHSPSSRLPTVYRDNTQYTYPSLAEDYVGVVQDSLWKLAQGRQDILDLQPHLADCCHLSYCSECPLPANTGDDVADDLVNKNRDDCLVMVPLKKVRCINDFVNAGYTRLYGLVGTAFQPGAKLPPTCTHADDTACSQEETANACSPR